jgi:hypothetical protein
MELYYCKLLTMFKKLIQYNFLKIDCERGEVLHACNPGTQEAEAGRLWVKGQPELQSEILLEKKEIVKSQTFIGISRTISNIIQKFCLKFHGRYKLQY